MTWTTGACRNGMEGNDMRDASSEPRQLEVQGDEGMKSEDRNVG